MVGAARAAAALAFAAAAAATDTPQTEGRWGPALAGGPRGRSSRPSRGPSQQRLRGGETAPSVCARSPAAAGDRSEVRVGPNACRDPEEPAPGAPPLRGLRTSECRAGGSLSWGRRVRTPTGDCTSIAPHPELWRAGAPGTLRRGVPQAPLSPFGVGGSKAGVCGVFWGPQ